MTASFAGDVSIWQPSLWFHFVGFDRDLARHESGTEAGAREINDERDLEKWIALVHDDEFPLGNFHLNLLRKLT